MDKEAQKKIEELLKSDNYNYAGIESNAEQILELMEDLGYRKPSKGKPPLRKKIAKAIYARVLSNIEIFAAITPMPWEKLTPEAKERWCKEADQVLTLISDKLPQERVLVKGLADIASNLGKGSFRPSKEDDGARPLRIKASETLKEAGYNYYECCGRDNIDGWFTEEEIQDLRDERR